MPIQHVQNRQRSRTPEAPTEEEEQDGFTTSFVPPPPTPAATGDAVDRPPEQSSFQPPSFAPPVNYVPPVLPRPTGETRNVKILSPVGIGGNAYAVGHIVPASCFSPGLERLLSLGVLEYTYEQISANPLDEVMSTAMKLAQPIATSQGGTPRAPWAQASIRDILGPFSLKSSAPQPVPGYSYLPAEHGQTLIVAQPQAPAASLPEPTVLSQEQIDEAAHEGFIAKENLDK